MTDERAIRRRDGSSEDPDPGHTVNSRMTVIPKRDGELSRYFIDNG